MLGLLRAIVTAFLIGCTSAQDASCDYSQYVQANSVYYVYSPNYPRPYPAGVQCRWIGVCPPGYNCKLDCTDIDIPKVPSTEEVTDTSIPQVPSSEEVTDIGITQVPSTEEVTDIDVPHVLSIEDTPSCRSDRLLISRTGDPQLTQAEYYCGRGTLSAVSTGQRISVGLITSLTSAGGRFMCKLTAQRDSPSTSCSCGYRRLDRIVGGVAASPKEFPMMAGVIYLDEREIRCGAVIIDKKYVLTAAHCVNTQPLNNLAVVVGEYDTTTGTDSPATKAFRVASSIVHPLFAPNTYDYDIAILKVDGVIEYSDYVAPVCLPFKFVNYDFAGAKVTVPGWGTIYPGGPTSDVLMKVTLDVISQASCQRNVSTLTPRQMCTYTRGKDSCQDDSGGPLLYTDPATGLLFHAGIVSFGRFCASTEPAVNTRVTALLNWIVTNAPANYCRK